MAIFGHFWPYNAPEAFFEPYLVENIKMKLYRAAIVTLGFGGPKQVLSKLEGHDSCAVPFLPLPMA